MNIAHLPLRRWYLAGALVTTVPVSAVPAYLAAQVSDAAETITAVDIARHVGVIAADSMGGRNTPSRGLELTAQYVADQFQRAGLTSAQDLAAHVQDFGLNGGRISTWFQRYPIPVDPASVSIVFATGTQRAAAKLMTAAYLPWKVVPKKPAKVGVLFVAGRPTMEALIQVRIDDKIVLYYGDKNDTSARRIASWIVNKSPGLVYLHDEDSVTFARRLQAESMDPLLQSEKPEWVAIIRAAGVPGLKDLLATVGVDLPRFHADTSVILELPSLQLSLERQRSDPDTDTAATAPNVVGVLTGSDSTLNGEYVVISAHMDAPDQPEGVHNNGADDNASGTAGLIMLARAFSQPDARPRRSVVFVATSGGAKPGFWGSRAFVQALSAGTFSEDNEVTLPVVADINLDMIGGLPHDSVTVDGLQTLDLSSSLRLVAALHPELRLIVVDGGTVFRPESDHFSFTNSRLVLPSLSIHSRRHEDSAHHLDSAVTVNADQAARIVRFAFYLSQEILNAPTRPRRNAEGRRQMLEARRQMLVDR